MSWRVGIVIGVEEVVRWVCAVGDVGRHGGGIRWSGEGGGVVFFFRGGATAVLYARRIVGSVRCV